MINPVWLVCIEYFLVPFLIVFLGYALYEYIDERRHNNQ